jgi:predicted O-methyltransferase YrrM
LLDVTSATLHQSTKRIIITMITYIKSAVKKLPILREIVAQRDRLHSERDRLHSERDRLHSELVFLKKNLQFVPPGHFYSPIPSLDEIRRDEAKIFGNIPSHISGVELDKAEQLKLLSAFAAYYKKMPFQAQKHKELRYYYENPAYSYSDAILLHCMIRYLKPKRIIEVGSGFSSCMILDTNDLFFDGSITTTFIEPYPDLLTSLINDEDTRNIKIIPTGLQAVDLSQFEALQENDILFIDSTHVSKINSDVNRVFFDILPRLSSGVHVHFHDIFFPFEYPKEWVFEGRAWNEAYILRAFLEYNSEFRVVLMNTFMQHFHKPFFKQNMPLCLQNPGGSIWICRK